MKLSLLISLALLPTSASSLAATPYSCEKAGRARLSLEPDRAGPARLARVYCLSIPHTPFPSTAPIVSPDGTRFFVFQNAKGLFRGTLDRETPLLFRSLHPSLAEFGARGQPAFAWAANSRDIFGADRSLVRPSGFLTGPIRPLLVTNSGAIRLLPEVRHGAGPLDGLQWVGRSGRALARLGTAGDYYRPSHPDRSPTIAIVDARRGQVLDALPLAAFTHTKFANVVVSTAVGEMLHDGKTRILFGFGKNQWRVWTQGSPLRKIDIGAKQFPRVALSRGGERLLVIDELQPNGIICELNPRCPPPTPVTGNFAELYDLAKGRRVWSQAARVSQWQGYAAPAISPDGKYALITDPRNPRYRLALVSMRDGHLIQSFPLPYSSGYSLSLSFREDGKELRISGGSIVAVYRLAN